MLMNRSLYCVSCKRQFHYSLSTFFTTQYGFFSLFQPHLPFRNASLHTTVHADRLGLANNRRGLHTTVHAKGVANSTRRGLHTTAHAKSHYATLGVANNATVEEIKAAYFKLSKELHPDVNIGKDGLEDKNNKFVRINEAYSVLGNARERRSYDLQMLIASDPRTVKWKDGNTTVSSNSPHHIHTFRTDPMSFEERLNAAGYKKQDPDFYAKQGNYHRKVVLYCILFITAGSLLQFGGFWYAWYGPGKARVDLVSQRNNEILRQSREGGRIRNVDGRVWTVEDFKMQKKNGEKKDLVVE